MIISSRKSTGDSSDPRLKASHWYFRGLGVPVQLGSCMEFSCSRCRGPIQNDKKTHLSKNIRKFPSRNLFWIYLLLANFAWLYGLSDMSVFKNQGHKQDGFPTNKDCYHQVHVVYPPCLGHGPYLSCNLVSPIMASHWAEKFERHSNDYSRLPIEGRLISSNELGM